jgi:putative component of toxin-antitoxin plasmid stabilization module
MNAIMISVAEVELHDEVVRWLDGLNDRDWDRTVVIVDRLADLGSQARMPLSRSLGEGLFELRFTLGPPHAGSATASPRTAGSSC